MRDEDVVELLFSGMEKLGPGGDVHTRNVLRLLSVPPDPVIVDAGCGTGRQTLVLAQELQARIHAVDIYEFFLRQLTARARSAGVEHLIETHCMDMREIPARFPRIDLLWSEGAAYNIGFGNALTTWAAAIKPGGFAAVSEMCWLREQVPERAREFFRQEYPGMASVERNIAAAEESGYRLLAAYPLPRETWVEGYYDVLGGRAGTLLGHPDEAVREAAVRMLQEIEVFEISQDSYGYLFFVLQRC